MVEVTFPKIGEKHKLTPLFTAEHTMKNEPKIPKKVIFIYSNSLEDKLKDVIKLSRSKFRLGEGGAWRAYNLITKNKDIIIVKLPSGAPFTAAAMEEAIFLGGNQFLIIGAAGGIKENISISDIVLCTKAIRDEGTSHHYIKSSKYAFPDKSLTKKIEVALSKNKIEFHKGTSWTTDAPYVETIEEIKHYRKEGVITVEMEASALFAVAKRRGVRAAAVFTVSDVLGREWSGFMDNDYKNNGYKKLARIAKLFNEMK